jgi:hypothetical protein
MPEYMPGYQSGDTLRRVPVDLPDGMAGSDSVNGKQVVESRYAITYQAAAAADVVIKANAGFLAGVTVGKDVAGGIIEISDHASDGDGNVVYYLEDPNVGYYPINAPFAVGMCADLTLQTNVTFHWR